MNAQDLHVLFSEIITGTSFISDSGLGDLYIKHLNQLNFLLIQKEYDKYFEEARNKKIPTYLNREKTIIESKDWPQEKENKIKETKTFIEGLQDKLSREYLHSRRKLFKKEIDDAVQRINKLFIEKNYLIGFTAEQYANKQSLYIQAKLSLYKDELLTQKFITDDISDEAEYNKLINLYEKSLENITQDSFKRIAISSFFNSMFSICGDNAYYFYGKPIVSLTNFQVELFLWGRYFKGLLSQYGNDIPPSMSKNPDDMMDFFEIRENTKKSGVLEGGDENTVGTTIIGGSKEDLKLMGVDTSQIRDIGQEIKKKGGMLTREDMYKLSN
jgi:hypothetical protein